MDRLSRWTETVSYSALRDNKKKIKKGVQGPRVVLNGRSGGGSPNMALNYDKNTLNNNLNKTLSKSCKDLWRNPLFWFWTAFDPENCIHGILSQGLAEAWPCEWAEWPRIWSPRAKDLSSPPPKLSIGIEPMSKTTKQSFQKTLSWHRKKDIQINTKVYLETKIHKLI